MSDSEEIAGQLLPQTHEVEGELIYSENGLDPYWLLISLLVNKYDGHAEDIPMEIGDESWTVELYYQEGGISAAPFDAVGGDTLYEPRIAIEGPDRRNINFHVRPRYAGMKAESSGEVIETPFNNENRPDEGYSVRISGSNVDVRRYPDLFCRSVHALAAGENVSRRYFRELSPMSNIHAVELYVRIRRELAESLLQEDGPLQRMSTLLSTKLGAEGAYYFSNSGPNRDVLGYRHRLLLNKSDADELLNRHRHGKQIKIYHPDKVRDQEDDPLYHPKLGILYHFSKEHLGNEGNSVPWSRLEELLRELRETLMNIVSWSGLTTKPDPTTYVSDDAFELREAEDPVQLVKDPLPRVEADQESLLLKTLGDLTPSDEQLLQVVADGGEVSVHEAAEETDRSLSTIYRALDRLGDLLRNDSGTLSFISEKIREDLSGVLRETETALESGVRRLCELLDLDPRQLEQKGSAWQKWLARWGAEAVEHGDQSERMLIKISTMMDRLRATDRPLVDEIVAEAYEAWCNSGGPRGDWWDAQVQWTNGADQTHTVSVSALLEPDGSPVRSAPG
ncbi:DUF7845 domain-containing protein [Haloplanus natans]|uniref:DUF7845 domain-containing protein n=1 Tax=Haloplanus natans TaxID=376171 RepID=UPI000677C4A2|nr:hypothetical protein [Haloplanus natans]